VIFFNPDKEDKRVRRRGFSKKYKGKYIGDWKILEDALDLAGKHPYRHILIVRCVHCGRVTHFPATYFTYKPELYLHCGCHSHRETPQDFITWRESMLLFLSQELNKARHEAVFAEDEERIDNFQRVIDFLGSKTLDKFFKPRGNKVLLSTKYVPRSKVRRSGYIADS
jgi:hypothetical protein